MNPPLVIGPLSSKQHQRLERGLRSRDGFELRRCHILLASARGDRPSQIGVHVGCTAQMVRNIRRAYRAEGYACLRARSSRPKHRTPLPADAHGERLRARLHQSPRPFGKTSSRWTLALLAAVGVKPGLTPRTVSIESSRRTLQRLGVGWNRAKHWITRPDPRYRAKKSSVIG